MLELGHRAQQQRVGLNLTQKQLAQKAGVSARTIERFEAGTPVQLDKLVRMLRALGLSDNLDQLIPQAGISPLQMVRSKSPVRQRAYTAKSKGDADTDWKWGDER
ncbi:MAG: helix-turn-helix domain-containing protein [Gammaproteobacteria bacterium]